MFFNSDNFESLREMIGKMDQKIEESQNSLSQEDQFIYSKLQNIKKEEEQKQVKFIPTQILNTFYKTPMIQQQQRDNSNIKNKDQIEIMENNDCNSSDTQSLSIINDQQQQFILVEQQQWQLILNQYGNFFKAFTSNIIIKSNQNINKLFSQDNLFQDQDNNNKVYLAFFIKSKEWIVVKEQELQDQSLIDTAQQFLIHDFIYQLYSTMFLKLIQPVYIDIDQEHVIYVEQKGWVLCDFENSIKYTQINGVYEIKGTYCFLLPQLQAKSKIRGIQLKQNLLQNDLYALAITLIVIKYQITSQDFIKQYLEYPKDPIIEILLKSVSLSDLQNYILNYEMIFIRPQLKQIQQYQSVTGFHDKQIVEFIYVLGNLNQIKQISNENKQYFLSKIDEQLKKNKQNNNYIDIICYSIIPQYVDQLKNIVKYKDLRQRKYWKNIINKLTVINNTQQISNQITFMQSIGLTDLCLFYAQQYIQIKYDYSIHIFMIDILDSFLNYEEAQKQFDILLTYREFYQMNQLEQNLFMQYTFKKFDKYRDVLQMVIKQQLQENKFNFAYHDISLLSHYSDEEFVEQFTLNIQKIIQADSQIWHWKLSNFREIIFNIFIVKNLQMSIKLLDIVKQNIKRQCTTLVWQDLIKIQILLNELARLNNNKKHIKEK